MSSKNQQAAEKAAAEKAAAEKAAAEKAAAEKALEDVQKSDQGGAPPAEVLVALVAPAGGTSITIGGTEYQVGKNGTAAVPSHLVGEALSHGFSHPKE